ncbi:hypothetical protein LR48_Vigan2542s000100 [Vigna angularis]|nr:hypothetical protein LR48_Vigan2542s000100 [Vigna angularis]
MSSPSASGFARKEVQGYADDVDASFSSTLGSGERNPPADDQAGSPGSENSSRILEDNEDDEVGINVDFTVSGMEGAKHGPLSLTMTELPTRSNFTLLPSIPVVQ